MTVKTLAAFLAVDMLLVLIPGADWAYAISAGLRDRLVLPAVAGLVIGYAGDTVLVVAGLAVLVAHTPGLLTGLTAAGAAYLMWLGGSTLCSPEAQPGVPFGASGGGTGGTPAAPGADDDQEPRLPLRAAVRGAGVSGLNPKGLLLYLALLPQFVRPGDGWPVPAQTGLLGVAHMADCAVVYLAVGTLARILLRTRVRAARAITRVSGAAMIAVGVALLIERLARP